MRLEDFASVNETIQDSEGEGANATLLMLSDDFDPFERIPTSSLVVGITGLEADRLEASLERQKGWALAWLYVISSIDCGLYQPVMYVWTVVCLGWILFLALWLCTTYYWHPHHVRTVHKALTILLACKVLQVYSAYSRLSACPFNNAPATLLHVLEGVCGTLFETSYYALLIVMSGGLFVVREELSRGTMNYLVGLVSMLYLGISVQNMLDTESRPLTVLILLFVWCNCSLFGCSSFLHLRHQLRVSPLSPLRQQLPSFLLFLSIQHVFFLSEMTYHLLLSPYLSHHISDPYKRLVWTISLHEAVQAAGVIAVFTVFSTTVYAYPTSIRHIRRPLPVYRSNSDCISTDISPLTPVIILNPGKNRVVSLGYVVEQPENREERRRNEVELSRRLG